MPGERLGIVVGGGPAPGINAVIGAATIQAINCGFRVYGIYDGFKWLSTSNFDPPEHTTRLEIDRVARIHFEGGSILRTARVSLLDSESVKKSVIVKPDEARVRAVISNLKELGINCLLTIGGDDTALSARFIADAAGDSIRIVHVPKTIDNDVPLPYNIATFGFSTARYIGTSLVKNLMQDSRTTSRWYICTCMGRSAGWLALSVGTSAGATVTLIPEEFEDSTKVSQIVDVLEGAILKRRAMGRSDGVAVIAEGLAYKLGDKSEMERLLGKPVPVDAAGHPRLSEIPLNMWLRDEVEKRFEARGEKISLVTHEIGYEMRSADPTPADMEYCRNLGYHSIRLFLAKNEYGGGVIVTMVNGNLYPIKLSDVIDPKTNRIQTRLIDVNSDTYAVARAYMIRLEQRDLENPDMLNRLAAEAHMSPADFAKRYARAAKRLFTEPPAPPVQDPDAQAEIVR
ncbi:MAG: 6-phosphofructokinase [Phycisphaerae bacterium]